MLKLVGALFLLIACASIGFFVARGYRERPRQLRYMMHAIRLLQTEIEYSVTPLPLAFQKVAIHVRSPCNILLDVAGTMLTNGNVSVIEAISTGIEEMKPKCSLKESDFIVIVDFASVLGMADRVHLAKQFKATLTHLEELEKEAQDAQKRNEKMSQYLGALTGLLLVILLY